MCYYREMFARLQKISPNHCLSQCAGRFAHSRRPGFKNWAIRRFIRHFSVDLTESLITDIHQFSSFNDFFIRRLKPEARLLPQETSAIACPADGVISEFGRIQAGQLLQAKNKYYSLQALLADDSVLAQSFLDGDFCTIYLAPKDYHRVHLPYDGELRQMIYVPGRLFSVNPASVSHVSQLFAHNERVICVFHTVFGPMAVIFVGATLVGSVVTPWHGQVMPVSVRKTQSYSYSNAAMVFRRGDEIGYFQWGSTVIMLFPADSVQWRDALQAGSSVRMGENLASCEAR
jgi:phosphatidylserine decarboxylase